MNEREISVGPAAPREIRESGLAPAFGRPRPWLRVARRVLTALTVLALLGLAWPGSQKPCIDGDSGSYQIWPKPWEASGVEIMLKRAPVYPILLKIIPQNELASVQALAAMAAWCCIGYAIFGYLGMILGGLFAFSFEVYQFNCIMWTESLSLSFTLVALACGIFLVNRWRWVTFGAWFFFMTGMALIKDTNLYLLPFFAFPAIGQWKSRARWVSILAVAALLFLAGNIDQRRNKRWRFNCTNAIVDRVLPNEKALAFFTRRGMPFNEGLGQLAHKIWLGEQVPFRTRYPEFFDWIDRHGLGVYQQWVLSQPESYTIIFKDFEYRTRFGFDYPSLGYHIQALPWIVDRFKHHWLYNYFPPLKLWLALLLLPLLDFVLNRRAGYLPWLTFLLILATYVNALVSYHGDAMETERHAFTASMLYRVSFFMGAAALVRMVKNKIFSIRQKGKIEYPEGVILNSPGSAKRHPGLTKTGESEH